jgi:hypothetical protein
MKRRRERTIEVFSMSAIDLFAAAMGAFALLAIILLPYYQNELREKTPDNAIAELARAAEESSVETKEKKKALEIKRSAMARNVSDIKSDAQELLDKLRAAEQSLQEKKAAATPPPAVVVPEPIEEEPGPLPEPATVSFRFLGMNTTADDVVIAMDMSRCMGGHEKSVNKAVERIVLSLQDNHAVKVVGFQQTDAGARLRQWPAGGNLRQINSGGTKTGAIDFAKGLTRQFGGSASMLDAFDKLLAGPGEAIFLVSDGLPNPRANDGLSPNRLVNEITRRNSGRKEIHSVVVGNYFDYRGTVEFMENLAARNGGQFMALASTSAGICD